MDDEEEQEQSKYIWYTHLTLFQNHPYQNYFLSLETFEVWVIYFLGYLISLTVFLFQVQILRIYSSACVLKYNTQLCCMNVKFCFSHVVKRVAKLALASTAKEQGS